MYETKIPEKYIYRIYGICLLLRYFCLSSLQSYYYYIIYFLMKSLSSSILVACFIFFIYNIIPGCSLLTNVPITDLKSNLLRLEFQKLRTKEDSLQINEWIREIENYQSNDSNNNNELIFPSLWSKLDGRWLLRYSNNAASFQELRRDSPLLSVEQIIDGSYIEHVLSFGSDAPLETQIVLKHSARVQSPSAPALLSLDLDGFELRLGRNLRLPSPPIPLPAILRRGFFEVH